MIEEKKELLELLSEECCDTKNINFSVTKAKGLITFFWSYTFSDKTNLEHYVENEEEINLANMKLDYLNTKYKDFYVKTRKLTESDVKHFDSVYETQKEAPVKKAWRSNTQSFGGYSQFSLK